MNPLDKYLETLASKCAPLRPSKLLAQLSDLINGPGSVRDKIQTLLTANQSPTQDIDIDTVSSELQAKLDKEGLQGYHLGIIADGNRRWAKAHGLDKTMGHKEGAAVIEDIIFPTICKIPQVTEMSIYLLSNMNSSRDQRELDHLYSLFRIEYRKLLQIAETHSIRYKHAGAKEGLPEDLQTLLSDLEKETASNNGKTINLCINYSATEEAGDAITRFASSIGSEELESMSPQEVAKIIQESSWIPTPVDMVLRTGGNSRFSGFIGNRPFDPNCQLMVEPKFLPELTEKDILKHLLCFAKEERRMGK